MLAANVAFEFKNIVVIALVVAFAMVLAYRLLNRDERIKRTRFGFFVERNRYEDEEDVHHIDPFSEANERPAPIPPPTPPPPLPPEDEPTWPQREEKP